MLDEVCTTPGIGAGDGIDFGAAVTVGVGVGVEAEVEERFSRVVGVLVTLLAVGRGVGVAGGCCA